LYKKLKWLSISGNENEFWTLEFLQKTIEAGEDLPADTDVKKRLEVLRQKCTIILDWEESAQEVLFGGYIINNNTSIYCR